MSKIPEANFLGELKQNETHETQAFGVPGQGVKLSIRSDVACTVRVRWGISQKHLDAPGHWFEVPRLESWQKTVAARGQWCAIAVTAKGNATSVRLEACTVAFYQEQPDTMAIHVEDARGNPTALISGDRGLLIDSMPLNADRDQVEMWGRTRDEAKKPLSITESGALEVSSSSLDVLESTLVSLEGAVGAGFASLEKMLERHHKEREDQLSEMGHLMVNIHQSLQGQSQILRAVAERQQPDTLDRNAGISSSRPPTP